MTKFHVKTNSSSYLRGKEIFIKELRHFHDTRGSTIRHLPVINGKEVDLYLLYMMVTHHGGWVKVNSQGLWDSMLKQLGLPASCVNGGVAIRQLYLRHLERWERARGGGGGGTTGGAGGDGDAGGSEVDDERPRRAAWGTPKPRNTVAHTYNYNQHNVPDHIRESTGMPPLQKLGGAIERLALSLMSPLPNEQDFALNVCTILAADSANKLPVQSTPHIVDFLLGHAAVYNHPSLRDVVGKSYLEARQVKVEWFWAEHSRPTATLELLDEDRFPVHGLAMRAIVSELSLNSRIAKDGTLISPDEKDPPIFEELASTILGDDEGILANRCAGGARDLVTRRISQIATIMRNLSFHEDNLTLLAKHQTFLRFILLCVNCSMSSIRQAGLDSFGNIAQEMTVKDPATCLLSRHVLSTLTTALQSDDRARILAALEILNKLAQNETNEDVLLRCLEQKVYEQVCSYLTLHDIMLLVVTLECVYALTSLGERSCDFIVKVHGVVDTLVSLITVEAQSYGPKACILMRVVETVPGGNNLPAPGRPATPPPNLPPPSAPPPSLTPLSPAQNTVVQPQQQLQLPPLVQTTSQPVVVQNVAQPSQIVAQPVQSIVSNVAQPAQAVPQTAAQQAATALSVQQQHAHQQAIQENEQFALAWLRTTWEPCPANIRLDSAELYKQYMACCNKVGRKGVIAPLHFPRCVRSVFGGVVGPNPIKLASGEVQQCYMGIRQRPSASKQAVIPQIKTGPASPILKAQLIKAEQMKTHPHLSQALDQSSAQPAQPQQCSSPPPLLQTVPSPSPSQAPTPTPTNTTLIKHLLAHKVSAAPEAADRMQHLQVTQRQNQQRMLGQSSPVTTAQIASAPGQPAAAMELDAEALISCSTITSTGVTSTSPLPPSILKGSPVPPLAAISNPITSVVKEELPDGTIIETTVIKNEGNIIKNEESGPYPANKMLADLLEKRSPPPLLSGQMLNQPEVASATIIVKDDESLDEPVAKKARTGEGVSSTAANLYAAFAASALEDEEELVTPVQTPTVQSPPVQQTMPQPQQMIMQQNQQTQQVQQNPQNQQMQTIEIQDQDSMRQVIMPSITNQGGQLILHGTPSKGIVSGNVSAQQFVSHSTPLQLIATQNNQGLGYIQGGVMPHKTIIILQSGNGNSPPITLTVNNSGALDESTLNNLISQASDVINQQQSLSNQSGNSVIQVQTNTGLIQTSTGVIQSTQAMMQPTQGMMHTTQAMIQTPQGMMHSSGIIKQQVVQGQAQLVASQQPVITQQPQSQIISTGHQMMTIPQQNQQVIMQGNQQQQFGQIITSNQQLLGGNQQIMVGNQQIVVGNQQIVMGNQIISSGGQQFISGNQQIVTMSQPFSGNNNAGNNNQQRIISGNQFIVDQQGNRQLVSGGQNIVISNQMQNMKNDKKIVVSSSQLMQSQKIIVGNQQHIVGQQVITEVPQRIVQGTSKIVTNQAPIETQKKLPPVTPVHKVPDEPWVCQWRGCDTVFESAAAVYSHACTAHCTRPESPCLWAHCDQLPRKRFSLMTHLQDRHCTAEALKTSLTQRRKGIIPVSATAAPPPPAPSATMERIDSPGPEGNTLGTPHPGYAPNAALHAIKRHAVDFLNPRELMHRAEASRNTVETPDDNEGPVTKSIRLTAALILRNICIYSHTGRRLVRGYEPHLAGIALSSVEASRTVAQVLYDMNCI